MTLDDLIALALAAGREIMSVRAAGFDAQTKDDGSLVTIADQRAEAIIEARLAELAPGVPMLGEEAVAAGRIADCSGRFFCRRSKIPGTAMSSRDREGRAQGPLGP